MHEVDLRQKGMAHVFKLRTALQPRGELFAPGSGDLVNDALGTALGGSAARAQELLFLEPFEAGIDLAEFGGPEMSDAVVQDGLQVVSASGLAEQAQQNIFEAHAHHYITYYIEVNCFSAEPATLRFRCFCQAVFRYGGLRDDVVCISSGKDWQFGFRRIEDR